VDLLLDLRHVEKVWRGVGHRIAPTLDNRGTLDHAAR